MESVAPDDTTDTNHPRILDLGAGRTPTKNLTLGETPRKWSRSTSVSPPRSGIHGRHDGHSESPSRTRNNLPPNNWHPWDNVPDTPQYDKTIDWEVNLAAGSHLIPPTNIATVSEETEILIKDACTVRVEHANRLKIRITYSLPQVVASRTP